MAQIVDALTYHMPKRRSLAYATKLVKRHEGERLLPYRCTEGYITIGVGRNLETNGIRKDECALMLKNDLAEVYEDLESFQYWDALSSTQQAALVSMRFNLGATGYRRFAKMDDALMLGDYEKAADEILDSKYAEQVPSRAKEISDLVREG